jgi:hypothetical protein
MAAPAAPVIVSVTFDQPSYTPGQQITATVAYTAGMSAATQTFTGTATDEVTQQTGSLTVSFTAVAADATTVSVSDSGGRDWAMQSDDGTTAVFTATA